VHGAQPGSAWNGHYRRRVYHPIVACAAETGDMLDARLRPGNAHTAEGALDFVLDLVDRLEGTMCQVGMVRMDAGLPEERLLAGMEARGTPYVARLRNNRAPDRMAAPHLRRPPARTAAGGAADVAP
jgi:Transposase DDE domain group 1